MLIGSPSVNGAKLTLSSGKAFEIKVTGNSDENIYVEKAILNGKELHSPSLSVSEFMSGGILALYMTDDKNKDCFLAVTQ